ncbi:MAG: aminotransferase class V-fold PLP-dependent enzyme [Candidatus Omnitrophica bacterium]|nr:aminotransferase class V-fold PLP-dependent enzyme [Candidatus Omnitrophota bacterium]
MKKNSDTIYADNAATTWPKPQCVIESMRNFFFNVGANPGRSGHRMSVNSARILFDAREETAAFFGLDNSQNVVFTLNATHALNIAIRGIPKKEGHVIISSFEHNSVIRPLTYLKEKEKTTISVVPVDCKGNFDMTEFKKSFRDNTQFVVINHGSNVTGAIAPIRQIGHVCKEKKVPLIVDVAQTAGTIPINVKKDNIDILIFTGHKGLMGPQGTGGLCLNNESLQSFFHGGTGSSSQEERHPDFMPDKLEAGTPNIIGIAGLATGIKYLRSIGLNTIVEKEKFLIKKLINGLRDNDKIIIYGPDSRQERLGILSFNIKNKAADIVGDLLDKEFSIMTRVGLHCAPYAHKSIGTFPAGTVRLSLSFMNTENDIAKIVSAVNNIADRS